MCNKPAEYQPDEYSSLQNSLLKIGKIVLFCGYSGFILSVLAYVVIHPYSFEIPVAFGILVTSVVGTLIGLTGSPLVVVFILRKDPRLTHPFILLTTGFTIIACGYYPHPQIEL